MAEGLIERDRLFRGFAHMAKLGEKVSALCFEDPRGREFQHTRSSRRQGQESTRRTKSPAERFRDWGP